MIETIMYAAIGFLSATLLALLTLPAVWRRAVRLTRRRIEAAMPISVTEFMAEKDQLRASFALEARRHEMDIGELRQRTAEQWAEISRQTEELRVRRIALDETRAALADLETRHSELERHDTHISSELAERSGELQATAAKLETTRRDLAETRLARDESLTRTDELMVENVALSTLRDTLGGRVSDLEHKLARTTAMLEEDRLSLRTTSENLEKERTRTSDLTGRLSLTESSLAATSSQAALVSAELSALKISADAIEKRSAMVEKERDEVRLAAENSNGLALSYQRAAEGAARQAQDQVTMLQAEKAMLEGALAKAREERNEVQARLDANRPATAAAVPAIEDSALLREHISDVAAEIARIAAVLEGPGSPVVSLLAAAPATKKKNGAALGLADRIRALQERTAADKPANGSAPRKAAAKEPGAASQSLVPDSLVAESPAPQDQVAAG